MVNPLAASLAPLGVYIHFPWCLSKCPYCDFVVHAAPRESIGAMLLESMRLDDEATVLAPDEVEIDIGPVSSLLNPNPESKRSS